MPSSAASSAICLSSRSTISAAVPPRSSFNVSLPIWIDASIVGSRMAPPSARESVIVPNFVFIDCGAALGSATKAVTAARSAASVRPARSRQTLTPRFQAFWNSVSFRFRRRPAAIFIMSGLLRRAARVESLHDRPASSAKSCSCGGLLRTSEAIWASTRARASRTFLDSTATGPCGPTPPFTCSRRISRTSWRVSGVMRFRRAALASATDAFVSVAMPSLARICAILSG